MAKTLLQNRKDEEDKKKLALFPLLPGSYKLLLIGIGIVIVGFVLMMGGGADSIDTFNYEIFSFRRITLAPIVVLIGFAFMAWVIIRKPKIENSDKTEK